MLVLYKTESSAVFAYPLEYSTPLQWLLNCLMNLTSAAGIPARLIPKTCQAPSKSHFVTHHSCFVTGMWLCRKWYPLQIADYSCLSLGISSNMRYINSLHAFFWHCKNRSYINIFVRLNLNLSSLHIYFGCCHGKMLTVIPPDNKWTRNPRDVEC